MTAPTLAKAQRLVAEGRVSITGRTPETLYGEVVGDHDTYACRVTSNGDEECCTCPAYTDFGNDCAHREALRMEWRREMSERTLAEVLPALRAEFVDVQIKPQTLSDDGTRALAVAYLDRADVQGRLNDVVPGQWSFTVQTLMPTGDGSWVCHGRLTVCGQERDDAGFASSSDSEPPKAAVSDALKRCATHFGIGEYLYRLPMEWRACESYTGRDGKLRFSKWVGGTAAPQHHEQPAARGAAPAPGGNGGERPAIREPGAAASEAQLRFLSKLADEKCGDEGQFEAWATFNIDGWSGLDNITKGQASAAIEALKALPKAEMAGVPV